MRPCCAKCIEAQTAGVKVAKQSRTPRARQNNVTYYIVRPSLTNRIALFEGINVGY